MKSTMISKRLAFSVCALALFVGACGEDQKDNLPPAPVATEESTKAQAKQVEEGRAGYKGAPGVPRSGSPAAK